MAAETRFSAMGSTAHVVVTGAEHLVSSARRRIDDLERRWSRFLPTSEISRLNARSGDVVVVSPDTYVLIERCIHAWRLTGGRFDPTVLPALRAAGYDSDFRRVSSRRDRGQPPPDHAAPAPGCAGIELFSELSAVMLPTGVELDPGGIGKGLAADIVTAELLEAGAAGALVNLGGDLRVRGFPPGASTWAITVEDPFDPGRELLRLGLEDGAVATSSRLRRTWTTNGHQVHHLIDPATGTSARGEMVAVTTVASEGWWAEAAAKAAFVGEALPAPTGTFVVAVGEDGAVVASPELSDLLMERVT